MKEFDPESDSQSESAAELLINLLASEHEFADFMDELASLAAAEIGQEVPILCSITLVQNKRAAVVGSSDESARLLEQIQADLEDGPGLEAQTSHSLVFVDDIRSEKRWSDYAVTADLLGLRSVLTLPLEIDQAAKATMTFYSEIPHRFDDSTISAARRFAHLVDRSLHVAARSVRLAETADHRRRAMESRTVIDVAVGITMAQAVCTQEEAVAILKEASSHRNIKLRTLAGDIVASLGHPEPTTPFTD